MDRTLFDPDEVPASLRDCFEEVETACGAPWRRVVERTPDNTGYPNGPGGEKHRLNGDRDESLRPGTLAEVARYATETVGWEAGCTCNAGDPIPALVLDPFCGSGTTLLTALRHGRRAIGLELSPEYVRLSEKRIVGDAPLFNSPEVNR